jgi:hypothetical protein
MKYMLFCFQEYEMCGGIGDLIAVSDDIDELLNNDEFLSKYSGDNSYRYSWWHIYDTENDKVIMGNEICHHHEGRYSEFKEAHRPRCCNE